MKKHSCVNYNLILMIIFIVLLISSTAFSLAYFTDKASVTKEDYNFGNIEINLGNSTNISLLDSVAQTVTRDVMPGDTIRISLKVNKSADSQDFYWKAKAIFSVTDPETFIDTGWSETLYNTVQNTNSVSIDFEINIYEFGNEFQNKTLYIGYEVRAIQMANITPQQANNAIEFTSENDWINGNFVIKTEPMKVVDSSGNKIAIKSGYLKEEVKAETIDGIVGLHTMYVENFGVYADFDILYMGTTSELVSTETYTMSLDGINFANEKYNIAKEQGYNYLVIVDDNKVPISYLSQNEEGVYYISSSGLSGELPIVIMGVKELESPEGLKYYINDSYASVEIGTCTDKVIHIPSIYYSNGVAYPVVAVGNMVGATTVYLPATLASILQVWAMTNEDCFKGVQHVYANGGYVHSNEKGTLLYMEYEGEKMLAWGADYLTNVVIENDVTWLYGFKENTTLKTVRFEMGSRLDWIEQEAFSGCTSLTSIEIPSSVTHIGNNAFSGCTSLTSVTFGTNSQLTRIESDVFSGCTSLSNIYLPDSVTSISSSAFDNVPALKQYDNAYYLDSTTEYAFLIKPIDTSITSCNIHPNTKVIANSAFSDCTSLSSVTFGANSQLTSIGDAAFNNCKSLTSIEIPSSVTSIGSHAFNNCNALNTVYYGGTESEWSAIIIGSYNTYLTNATKYYYSETDTGADNIWHYVDGVPTKW